MGVNALGANIRGIYSSRGDKLKSEQMATKMIGKVDQTEAIWSRKTSFQHTS